MSATVDACKRTDGAADDGTLPGAVLALPARTLPSRLPEVTLTGRHVTLRPYRPEDTPLLFAVTCGEPCFGDPAYDAAERVWKYLSYGPFENVEALAANQAHVHSFDDMRGMCVVDNATGKPIGHYGWMRNSPRHLYAELGHIWICPSFHRTYANTEAALLSMTHLFGMGYRRVEWKCDAANAKSCGAALGLGFQHELVFRQHRVTLGRNRDTAWFSITDSEWPRVRKQLEAKLERYGTATAPPAASDASAATAEATADPAGAGDGATGAGDTAAGAGGAGAGERPGLGAGDGAAAVLGREERVRRLGEAADVSTLPSAVIECEARAGPARLPEATLVGPHVTLRPFDAETDAAGLYAASNGEACYGHEAYDAGALWRFMPHGPHASLGEFERDVRAVGQVPHLRAFCVVDNATGRRIGFYTILNNVPQHLRAELGYIWFTPAYQRTYANTECALLTMRHLFSLGYRRVEWKCDARHSGSRRAALRLGFTHEGVFRNHLIVKGKNRDTAWFSVLDKEWPAIEAALEARLAKHDASM